MDRGLQGEVRRPHGSGEKEMTKPSKRSKLAASKADGAFDRAVGVRLRARRLAHDLTQGQLGEKIGRSLSQVSKYELGEHSIELPCLARIAGVLGCKASEFIDGIGI